jgi:hypothetical protein
MREIFVWRGRGLVVCRWGELRIGRRKTNRGGEGRRRGHILTFADGLINGLLTFADGFTDRIIHR